MIDIQPPTLPVVEEWNQLQVLKKEREMIGLYLSAHPLDEYKMILNHMCRTKLSDLDRLEELDGQEIAVAGVVTSVQNLTSKTGRGWGRFTLEDYEGTSREFSLFGKDYESLRAFLYQDYFLMVKGKVQPRPYREPRELEFKILSMVQLAELRDNMIKELHITLPVNELVDSFVEEFVGKITANKGNTLLRMSVVSRENGVNVNLYSRRYKVALTTDLVEFLDRNEIKYSLS
jgi:DNA polymerase-3 subunit alpha